jgi:hypothetical protein
MEPSEAPYATIKPQLIFRERSIHVIAVPGGNNSIASWSIALKGYEPATLLIILPG